MIEITEMPIVPQEFIDRVTDARNGAVLTFMGTVRQLSDGRVIQYMEYDAYKEMAEKKLTEIVNEAKDRWSTDDISVSHRHGRLELTDISVIIAVGTPHRAEAFEACRYVIEQIKQRLPIWKKEVDADGAGEWVEGHVPAHSH